MANDRLFLKCNTCGTTHLLAKYYPSLGHGIWDGERLDNYVTKHMLCSPEFGATHLNGDSCFSIFAETDPKFGELHQPEAPRCNP